MTVQQQQEAIALIRQRVGSKNANETIDAIVQYSPRGVYDYIRKFYAGFPVWGKGVERESGRQRQMANFLKGKYVIEQAGGKGDLWEIHFVQNVKGNKKP